MNNIDYTNVLRERDYYKSEVGKLKHQLQVKSLEITELQSENAKLKSRLLDISSESTKKTESRLSMLDTKQLNISSLQTNTTERSPVSPFFEKPREILSSEMIPSPPKRSGSPSEAKKTTVATPPRNLTQSPRQFRMSTIAPPPPLRLSSSNPSLNDSVEVQQQSPIELLRKDVLGAMTNAFDNLDKKEKDELDENEANLKVDIPSPPKEKLPSPPESTERPSSPTVEKKPLKILTAVDNKVLSPTRSLSPQLQSPSRKKLVNVNKSESVLIDDRINLLGAEIDTLRIEVPYSNVILNEAGKECTTFVISVHLYKKNNVINLWRLQKRYSDFLELNEVLQNQLPNGTIQSLGVLPKSVFQNHTGMAPSKTDKRRMTLKNYLSSIIQMTADPAIQANNPMAPLAIITVLRFLCTDIMEPESKKLFNSVMEGYLTKRGRRFGGWKRRYFVLIHDQLVYWESKEYAALCHQAMKEMNLQQPGPSIIWHPTLGPHGIFNLRGSKISKQKPVLSDESESPSSYRHAFMVAESSGNQKKSVLCAESDVERDEWVYYLMKRCEKIHNKELPEIKLFKSDEALKQEKTFSMVRPSSPDKVDALQEEPKAPMTSRSGSSQKDAAKASDSSLTDQSDAGTEEGRIFGVPLKKAVEISRVKENYELPSVVYRCIEFLEEKGALKELGIYRLNGSNSTIESIRKRFNQEGDVDLLKEHPHLDVHVIACLLKRYLRELPESVFTQELHRSFLHVTDLLERSDRVVELARLVSLLPLPNYTLLRTLMAHFIRIIRHSEINKMNARNIGIVFAPTLHAPAGIFTLLIQEFEFIFWVHNDHSGEETSEKTDSETASDKSKSPESIAKESSAKLLLSDNKQEKRRSWRADEIQVEGRNPRNSLIFEKSAPETVRFYEKWITAEDLEVEGEGSDYAQNESDVEEIDLNVSKNKLVEDANEKNRSDSMDNGNNGVLIFDSYVDLSSRPVSISIEDLKRAEDDAESDYDYEENEDDEDENDKVSLL